MPTLSLCSHRPPFLVGVSRWKCPLCRGANLRCQPRYSTRKDVTPPPPLSLPLFFAPFVSVLYPVQPAHPQNYVHSENEYSSEPRPSKANKNASCTVKRHVFALISRNDNSHYFLPAPYFRRRLLGTAHSPHRLSIERNELPSSVRLFEGDTHMFLHRGLNGSCFSKRYANFDPFPVDSSFTLTILIAGD